MPSLTTSQKIAIAVSVPVVGVLFYFLLKWSREDEQFADDAAAEETDEFRASADLFSEVQIQQRHAGAVIGRRGSVIREIQKESQTRINFKDDDDESGDEVTASEEAKPRVRTILIRGSRERIKQAEVLIQKIIDEQPVLEKVKIKIPQRLIGRIIGKGGKTIRQLCRISGAKIKFDREDMGEVRTCEIVGTGTQIECAKQLIDEKIDEDKAFRAKKDTQEAKDKLTFAHLPTDGDFFGAYVSAFDTPGHFWIQNITKDSKQLDDLVEEMTQFYGDKAQGHRLTQPKVGDMCCAAFQHDESWYRGKIVEVMEDAGQVRIQYLDFGDAGAVDASSVKEIRKEFCSLPFQAIECYLANVQPKDEKWSQEACNVFEKLSYCAQWKVLMAKVMYYDENGVPCIALIDTNGPEDVNIEAKLVELGYAVYKEKMTNKEEGTNEPPNSGQSSDATVEQIIAEEKAITLEKINQQFRSPGFDDLSFDTDSSESLEFPSPLVTSNPNKNDKEMADEPRIAATEHQVVSCADISQLGSLFDKLNVDSSASIAEVEDLEKSKTDIVSGENLLEEGNEDEVPSNLNPAESQEESLFSSSTLNNLETHGSISEHPIQEPKAEQVVETITAAVVDDIPLVLLQEDFESDGTTEDQVSKDMDAIESISEAPITSSVAVNAEESFEGPFTSSNAQLTETAVPEYNSEVDPSFSTAYTLNDINNQIPSSDDELSLTKGTPNLPMSFDQPVTSTPEYHPKPHSETTVKPVATGFANQAKQNGDILDNGPDRAEHVLRRSCSEDLTNDDTLIDRTFGRSSSEVTVSPSKDDGVDITDSKPQLSSRSLGSLSTTPKGNKRVLAANFGQMPTKPESEHEEEDEEDDDESLYLSAREDSDSTGFLSAIGSRSNLRNIDTDTDSDATPSGYQSDPEDDSIVIDETADFKDQARLDTTLLVEKLDSYADK